MKSMQRGCISSRDSGLRSLLPRSCADFMQDAGATACSHAHTVRVRSFSTPKEDVAGPVIKATQVSLAGRLSRARPVITIEGGSM